MRKFIIKTTAIAAIFCVGTALAHDVGYRHSHRWGAAVGGDGGKGGGGYYGGEGGGGGRGWACEANTVEIQINDNDKQNVPYGSNRGDTESVCGDNNNGFGFTYNWNSLGNGTHTLKLFIDGIEFTRATFTVTTLGVEYLQGVSKESTVTNFPQPGMSVKLRWSEPHQNFVIVPINP